MDLEPGRIFDKGGWGLFLKISDPRGELKLMDKTEGSQDEG